MRTNTTDRVRRPDRVQRRNVGTLDRTVRLFFGPALLVVAAAGLLGVVPLGTVTVLCALVLGGGLTVTGLGRTCPLYRLVGFDTRVVVGRLG
ncbi:YgaP family membrane protein [Salinigranum rubrum]|nr:DUF2892 domain-containing protein [Salinigranum rubrum]